MALEFVQTESEIALESSAATLVVFDLRKSFVTPSGKQIEVLRGVSFEVKAGETVAIVGASGSGKSTLLHSLGTLEDPDHGEISLANQSFSSHFVAFEAFVAGFYASAAVSTILPTVF